MVGVILFRAQPFHNGHLYMIKKAYEDCRQNQSDLYVFVGSADKSDTIVIHKTIICFCCECSM